MKKILLFIAFAVLTVTSTCAAGVVYKNAQFGFSVTLPTGFRPQNNDKAMERERGGKVYMGNKCMVDMVAYDKSSMAITPQEAIAIDAQWVTINESAGERLITKQIKETEMIAKWEDQFGLRALYIKYVGTMKYEISFTYNKSQAKQFDTQVDAIIASLTTK